MDWQLLTFTKRAVELTLRPIHFALIVSNHIVVYRLDCLLIAYATLVRCYCECSNAFVLTYPDTNGPTGA